MWVGELYRLQIQSGSIPRPKTPCQGGAAGTIGIRPARPSCLQKITVDVAATYTSDIPLRGSVQSGAARAGESHPDLPPRGPLDCTRGGEAPAPGAAIEPRGWRVVLGTLVPGIGFRKLSSGG